ncbi:PREDICTED: uncharacterized protein LOC107351694 [Acropora digitifera]|uniref:uncharacterized protein LOC107351694 n=1 Tax=Acropora digitifera TaxID=70779 RepID=UPI000779FC0C|nr:PREDICTED: uncharacterized protein LOC107351694 [Acropora digitifera]
MELMSSSGASADTRTREPSTQAKPVPRQKKTSPKSDTRAARFQYDPTAAPRFPDYEARLADQQQLAILAVMNEKEALLLQKRKDKQVLVDWREKTKIIRQQKQRLAAIEGVTPGELSWTPQGYTKCLKEIFEEKDSREATFAAVFIITSKHLAMFTTPIYSNKIREHPPPFTAADSSVERAQQIQRDVIDRKNLEYRLRAFTGDDVISSNWDSRSKKKIPPK